LIKEYNFYLTYFIKSKSINYTAENLKDDRCRQEIVRIRFTHDIYVTYTIDKCAYMRETDL